MKKGAKNLPLVSIAVCTYNGQKYLREQLDTLVFQTYKNIEIVVVDDCSSDQTTSILQEYKTNHENFTYIANEINLGYAKNFEKAIGLCKGKYISLSDQDDIWALDKIEIQVAEIGQHALVYHDSKCIDEQGNEMKQNLSDVYRLYQGKSSLPFLCYNSVSGHSMLFDRDLIPFLLPFDKRFFHDRWIAFIAAERGGIKLLNQKLVSYRQHNRSITDFLKLKDTGIEEKHRFFNEELINWAKKCEQSSVFDKQFYQSFLSCFDGGNNLAKKYKLFLLLVTHLNLLFYINKKSTISKLNLARKLCFGTS
jgi:glycosyltransferase involved in cell wall biosynthesis